MLVTKSYFFSLAPWSPCCCCDKQNWCGSAICCDEPAITTNTTLNLCNQTPHLPFLNTGICHNGIMAEGQNESLQPAYGDSSVGGVCMNIKLRCWISQIPMLSVYNKVKCSCRKLGMIKVLKDRPTGKHQSLNKSPIMASASRCLPMIKNRKLTGRP